MKRFLSLFLLVLLLVPNLALGSALPTPEPKVDLIFFEEVLKYIEDRHPFDIEESTLLEAGLKGVLQAVDPYSNYYTAEEAEELYQDISGEFTGIGVYIEEKDGYINIIDTIKNQPAEKAGLKKDDLIIGVGEKDIKGLGSKKVSSLIKGPVGSKVKLKIKRGEKVLVIEVARETISINPVEYKILENNIGYIELKEFTGQATKEINKALKSFDNKKVNKIILDLRDNPGGLLSESISISRLFVPKGPIVHIREKDKALLTHTSTLEKPKYKLIVLVNENSASASEIVAGAVKDRKAGKLVGTKTYGKGIVQSMMPLSDGSMIKLTIAEYLTPNKTSINGIGIEPDYTIENTEEEDLQLKAAIELLKK